MGNCLEIKGLDICSNFFIDSKTMISPYKGHSSVT